MAKITGFGIENLKAALDAASLRQQSISNNIANANTKGYKAKRVNFEQALTNEMNILLKTTDNNHISSNQTENGNSPAVYEDDRAPLREDGNNVDIDEEMVLLAKNQLLYNSLVQQTNKKLSNLRYVISEGKR